MSEQRKRRPNLKITPQQRKAARVLIREQRAPQDALRIAGYSRSTAQRGTHQILDSVGLRLAILAEIAKANKIALPTAQEQADFVRWRLLINAAQGKDAGVQSLKLLGADKRCSLWQPDSVLGMIVIEVPRGLPDLARIPEPGQN